MSMINPKVNFDDSPSTQPDTTPVCRLSCLNDSKKIDVIKGDNSLLTPDSQLKSTVVVQFAGTLDIFFTPLLIEALQRFAFMEYNIVLFFSVMCREKAVFSLVSLRVYRQSDMSVF